MTQPSPRLRKLRVDELDDDQLALYRAITDGPRASGPQAFALVDSHGGLEGPFDAMLRSPVLGDALQSLGAAIRYRGTLDDGSREIAILVVAHAWDSDFEISAHEAVGRMVGLDDRTVQAIRSGDLDSLPDAYQRLVATTTRALVTESDLHDDEYRIAADILGDAVLIELVTLVGYYATLALMLRVFRVGASPAP